MKEKGELNSSQETKVQSTYLVLFLEVKIYLNFLGVAGGLPWQALRKSKMGEGISYLRKNYVQAFFKVSLEQENVSHENSHQNALTAEDFNDQIDKPVYSEVLPHCSEWFLNGSTNKVSNGTKRSICRDFLQRPSLPVSVTNLTLNIMMTYHWYPRSPTSHVVGDESLFVMEGVAICSHCT